MNSISYSPPDSPREWHKAAARWDGPNHIFLTREAPLSGFSRMSLTVAGNFQTLQEPLRGMKGSLAHSLLSCGGVQYLRAGDWWHQVVALVQRRDSCVSRSREN